jgi:hypothetical protein
MTDRLRHDLRFAEWQDDHDANTRKMGGIGFRTARVDDFSPVLVRALSLLGPGELRALRVQDVDVFRLVTSLLPTVSGGEWAPHIKRSIDALCAVQIADYFTPSHDLSSLTALLKRHSLTITEIEVAFASSLSATTLEETCAAIACCTRLESLADVSRLAPAVWLGLSQLHTLHDVDVRDVSFATIAAALPRLHTLKACGYCDDPAQAAGLFTDLLPRLRVFHFTGRWPDVPEQPVSTVPPLPLLQELVWLASSSIAPRGFLGAQPKVLDVPYTLISQCWLESGVDAPASFLTRVYHLRILSSDVDPLDPADVARVLRAAPQLNKFHAAHRVRGAASWLAPTAPTHPAFEGLVHPRLRKFGVVSADGVRADTTPTPPDVEWVTHLRRRHFPRLRELAVGKDVCFVTPLGNSAWQEDASFFRNE